MAGWLLKTEPSEYSIGDLVKAVAKAKDKTVLWDGVANALALKHMREAKPGDVCLIYHTGKEKSIVGTAKVMGTAVSADEAGKLWALPLGEPELLQVPVTLVTIKLDIAFKGWDLLKIGRLSVVPTPESMIRRVLKLGQEPQGKQAGK